MLHGQNTVLVVLAPARGRRPGRARAAAVRPLPRRTTPASASSRSSPTRSPSRATATRSAPARDSRCSACSCAARHAGLHPGRRHAPRDRLLPPKRAAATTAAARCGRPGMFSVTLDRQHEAATLIAIDRAVGGGDRPCRPMDALRAERARRRRLIDQAHPTLRDGPADELVAGRRQFIIAPPAGRGAAARPRPTTADARPHGDRRLPLVHRLGPRHHDQPRRADAGHRPPRRGRLHPAHLRPATSATA